MQSEIIAFIISLFYYILNENVSVRIVKIRLRKRIEISSSQFGFISGIFTL